jgi:HTH-type transcriptional regulator/antitoxin HigA
MPIFQPAEVFAPGEFIQDELEARGWTHSDLAERMGCSPALVAELVDSHAPITADTAGRLAGAFDTSRQLWLNLDATFRQHRKR